jgi:hypothetical protein
MSQSRAIKKKDKKEPKISEELQRESSSPMSVNAAGDDFVYID